MDTLKSTVAHLANLALILSMGFVYVTALGVGTAFKHLSAMVNDSMTKVARLFDRQTTVDKPTP